MKNTDTIAKIKRILVPVALNKDFEIPLNQALYFREAYGSEIILLHVAPEFSYFHKILSQERLEKLNRKALKKLKKLLHKMFNGMVPDFLSIRIVNGALIPSVLKIAEETRSDLIIIKKHERMRGRYRFFKRENADRLLASANCPVVSLSEEPDNYKINTILFPIDITSKADQKVAWAIYLAKHLHANIHMVFVQNVNLHPDSSYALKKGLAIERILSKEGFNTKVEILKTKDKTPDEAILQYASRIRPDLILVMTQKESIIPGNTLGNIAREILHKSEFPVFSVTPGNKTIFDHILSQKKNIVDVSHKTI